MSIFDINGKTVTKGYDVFGNAVSALFDINGNRMTESWDDLTDEISTMLNTAMTYCADYIGENPQAYAFPLITDAHLTFDGNEPKYIEHCYPNIWSRLLLLGDMVNNTSSYNETELDDAVSFMNGASKLNKLVAIGNHELGNWAEGDTLPEEWYKPLLDPTSVLWGGGDGLIYYSDDTENNVRYIVLDSCTPTYTANGVQLFTMNQLEWCASVMESAGGKDIIICNHAMGQSYYLVTDTEKENSIAATTITNSGTLSAVINAFISKGAYSVTDDSGVAHSHDFSGTTGHFVGYFTGHAHQAGHTDAPGFHKITAPMLKNTYSGYPQGMSFFIVDRTQKKIIWLICWYADASIATYEYSYT